MNKIIQLLLGIPDSDSFTLTPPIIPSSSEYSTKVLSPFDFINQLDGPIIDKKYVLLSACGMFNPQYCVYTGTVNDKTSFDYSSNEKNLQKNEISIDPRTQKSGIKITKNALDIQTAIVNLEGKTVPGLEDTPLTVLKREIYTTVSISAYRQLFVSYFEQRNQQRTENDSKKWVDKGNVSKLDAPAPAPAPA